MKTNKTFLKGNLNNDSDIKRYRKCVFSAILSRYLKKEPYKPKLLTWQWDFNFLYDWYTRNLMLPTYLCDEGKSGKTQLFLEWEHFSLLEIHTNIPL